MGSGVFLLCVGPFGPEIAGGNVGGVLSTLWPLPGALSHVVCALRAFCIIKYWEGPPLPLPNHLETCFFGFPTPKKGGGRVPFTLWGTRAPHTLGVSVWGILAICQSSWCMRALYCPIIVPSIQKGPLLMPDYRNWGRSPAGQAPVMLPECSQGMTYEGVP